MTFSEIVEQNPNLYQGTEVDEATQSNLFDWFQFRQVCDNDKFITFYTRKLNLEWNHYQELLRIEPGPGLASYDWLVTDYKERQHKNKFNENNNNQIKSNEENTNEGTQIAKLTKGTAQEKTGTETLNLSSSEEFSSQGDSTNKITKTGTGEQKEKGTNTEDTTTNNTQGQQVDTKTAENTNKSTKAQSVKNEKTSNGTTKNDGYNLTYSDDKHVSSVNPMDLKGNITKGVLNVNFDGNNDGENDQPAPVGQYVSDLDWATATAQEESSGYRLDSRNTKDTTNNTETDLTTYGEGSDTITDNSNESITTGERKDTSNTIGTNNIDNTINTESNTEENGEADYSDTGSTERTGKNEEVYNWKISETGEDVNNITNTGKTSKNSEKNEEGIRSGFSTDQEVISGRNNQNIATILEDASRFIKNSDAFDWLRKQLEVCFFGIYDI